MTERTSTDGHLLLPSASWALLGGSALHVVPPTFLLEAGVIYLGGLLLLLGLAWRAHDE
mgnify:CR=1 FL=1